MRKKRRKESEGNPSCVLFQISITVMVTTVCVSVVFVCGWVEVCVCVLVCVHDEINFVL